MSTISSHPHTRTTANTSTPTAPITPLSDAFFRRQPVTGEFVTREGDRIPTPFAVLAEATIIYFLADYEKVRRRMQGTGLTPVKHGKASAVGQLWLMRYLNSGIGPYQEAAVTYAVNRRAIDIADDGGFSVFAPALVGNNLLFADKLVLDFGPAIRGGRQWTSFDKSEARFAVSREPGGVLHAKIDDPSGAPVIAMRLKLHEGLVAKATGLWRVRPVVGWRKFLTLIGQAAMQALTQRGVVLGVVNRDLDDPTRIREVEMTVLQSPTLWRLASDDRVEVFANGPFVALLAELNPRFVGVVRDPALKATFDLTPRRGI